MQRQSHWDAVYSTRGERQLSWFEALPALSLRMLEAAGPDARDLRARCRRRGLAAGRRARRTRARLPGRARCLGRRPAPRAGETGGFGFNPHLDRSRRGRRLVAQADGHLARPRRVPLPDRARRSQSIPEPPPRDAQAWRRGNRGNVCPGRSGEVQRATRGALLHRNAISRVPNRFSSWSRPRHTFTRRRGAPRSPSSTAASGRMH